MINGYNSVAKLTICQKSQNAVVWEIVKQLPIVENDNYLLRDLTTGELGSYP